MVLSLLKNQTKKRLAMEFRNDEIRFIEATVKQGKIQKIIRLKQYPLPQDLKDGKIDDIEGLAKTIKKWKKDNHWRGKGIHLTIPSTLIFVRKQELPNLPIPDLKEIINQEIGSTIQLPFENPVIDIVKLKNTEQKKDNEKGIIRSKPKGKQKQDGEEYDKCEAMIVAAPGNYIYPLIEAVELAGLKPLSIDIPALSLYRFILPFDKSIGDLTVLIVSINRDDIDIHIIDRNVLRLSRNVPMNIASYEKVNIQSTLEEIVDQVKSPLFNIEEHENFESYAQDLATELSRSVNFYERSMNGQPLSIKQMFLTGQSLPSERLQSIVSERLNFPCSWMISPPVSRKLSDENYVGYATVIGLVMKEVK